jgi:hypothetical protein
MGMTWFFFRKIRNNNIRFMQYQSKQTLWTIFQATFSQAEQKKFEKAWEDIHSSVIAGGSGIDTYIAHSRALQEQFSTIPRYLKMWQRARLRSHDIARTWERFIFGLRSCHVRRAAQTEPLEFDGLYAGVTKMSRREISLSLSEEYKESTLACIKSEIILSRPLGFLESKGGSGASDGTNSREDSVASDEDISEDGTEQSVPDYKLHAGDGDPSQKGTSDIKAHKDSGGPFLKLKGGVESNDGTNSGEDSDASNEDISEDGSEQSDQDYKPNPDDGDPSDKETGHTKANKDSKVRMGTWETIVKDGPQLLQSGKLEMLIKSLLEYAQERNVNETKNYGYEQNAPDTAEQVLADLVADIPDDRDFYGVHCRLETECDFSFHCFHHMHVSLLFVECETVSIECRHREDSPRTCENETIVQGS